MKPQHYVGIDVGTSEVRCIVGMNDPKDGKPSIIGHGSCVNRGMRRGMIVHANDVADAISSAVNEAERIAGVPIRAASINVNGSQVSGIDSEGVIAISAANREITAEDRMRVDDAATIVNLPQNREIVQYFAKNYSLDGQKNIKDPIGMHGVRLEVEAHIVTSTTASMKSLDMALEKAGIIANNHSVSSLAAAEAVMTRQQKEAGTLLLDIGAGTTNVIVFEDGDIQYISVIPIGGQHISSDLAIGLKTDLEVAEEIKIKFADLRDSAKNTSRMVKLDNRKESFILDDIRMIIEARVDELMELVDKELQKIKKQRKLPGGVILTGGCANIPGLSEYVREKLQLAARVGKIHNVGGLVDTVDNSSYTTAVGLMLLDMLMLPSLPANLGPKDKLQNAKGLIGKFIGKVKP